MLAVLGVLIFFMFRNSRKRKADLEKLQSQIRPGAEIMTNFGVFGTLLSVDEISNVAEVETSPGTVIRVHRQTITRVINGDDADSDAPRSVEEAMARATAEQEEREKAEALAAAPEFGERTVEAATPADSQDVTIDSVTDDDATVVKKPRARKNIDE